MPQQCEYYDPKGPDLKVNCTNCKLWVGPRCLNHLTLLKEYETTKKFKALDRMMRDNRGVIIP